MLVLVAHLSVPVFAFVLSVLLLVAMFVYWPAYTYTLLLLLLLVLASTSLYPPWYLNLPL